MKENLFDLTNVKFIKRIVLGSSDHTNIEEDEVNETIAILNRCLSESPKGRIIGMEKHFTIINIGEHQVINQWLVYNVGFYRKPIWLE